MPVTLVLAYPKGSDIKVDYYISTHMPVAWNAWKSVAKSYKISIPAADSPSPYELILSVEWDSLEAMGAAMEAVPAETMQWLKDDLPKYSTQPPVTWTQVVEKEVLGGSS